MAEQNKPSLNDRFNDFVDNAIDRVAPLDNLIDNFAIKENPLASYLGVTSINDNMIQFFNRFGTDSGLQEKVLATVIQKPYYFNCIWTFKPFQSKIEQLFVNSTRERSLEAMKYFIQSIDLPDFEGYLDPGTTSTYYGNVSNTGIYIQPTANTFTVDFLSTEFSLHEHVFYYWLRETTANDWQYRDRPFTKCVLRIGFFDSEDKKRMFEYVIKNVYPTGIETLKPSHDGTEKLTRRVTFAFDCMYVQSASKKIKGRLEKAFDEFVVDKIERKITTGVNKVLDDIPFL